MDALFDAPIGALLIFCLRIVDVSLSMMRMLLAVRGHRLMAACLGFFEVLIWLIAVGNALQHLNSVYHIIGYAAGFATGNYVGVWLEGRFAIGVNVVRAVFRGNEALGATAARLLRDSGFAVTEFSGRGREGEVEILNIVAQRKLIRHVMEVIHNVDDEAFVTVSEVRSTSGGHIQSGFDAPNGYVRPGGRKMPFLTRF